MDAIVKWALGIIDKVPPIPASNLLAFIVIGVLIAGLIRKAMRSPPPEPLPEAVPMVLLDAGSVYTVLTSIQMEVTKLNGRMETVEQMVRRRQKPVRRRKKKDADHAEAG